MKNENIFRAVQYEFDRLSCDHELWGWKLKFSKQMKRSFGSCNFRKKEIKVSEFSIETGLSDLNEALDTVRHEIAHALTPGCGHNERWQAVAYSIGAKPSRGSCGVKKLEDKDFKWFLVDTTEGKILKRYHKKPSKDYSQCWITSKGKATMGSLKVIPASQFLRS